MTVRRTKRKNADGTSTERWMVDVDWQRPDGTRTRVRKTSPVQNKRGAEQYEQQLRAELLSGRRVERDTPEAQTLREFAREWLDVYVRAQCKPATLVARSSQVAALLTTLGDVRLDEITTEHVSRHVTTMAREGYHARTIGNQLAALGGMLRAAREWGRPVATLKIKSPKAPAPEEKYLADDEVTALLATGDSLVIVGLETGLRVSELRGLQWGDVDWRKGSVMVRRSIDDAGNVGSPKSGKRREIPLSERATTALQSIAGERGLWVWLYAGTHATRSQIEHRLATACTRAGVRVVTPHVLRHTFASRLVRAGVSLRVVQVLLGHASITKTERYSHLAESDTSHAICKLNGNLTATPETTTAKVLQFKGR